MSRTNKYKPFLAYVKPTVLARIDAIVEERELDNRADLIRQWINVGLEREEKRAQNARAKRASKSA